MDNTRAGIGRFGILVLLALLGWLFYATGANRAAVAATVVAPVGAVKVDPAVLPQAGPATAANVVAVQWLTQCSTNATDLGLYVSTDAPCHPSRSVSLTWLQSHLLNYGVLSTHEYLERVALPNAPTCLAAVMSNGSVAGWLCADARGLYRLDKNGLDGGARWVVWSE